MIDGLGGSTDLFDILPCGVVVTDAKGTILRVNHAFCASVKYSLDELVQRRKLQDLFTIGGRIFHQTHWMPSLQMQGSLAEVKFDVRRSDGVVLPMMVNAVRKKQGDVYVDVLTLTVAEERNKYERELVSARKRADVLLEKEREAQLALADRALFAEQMIGIVSHDLRNPLSAILMGAQALARSEGPAATRNARLTQTIMSSARSAQRLIEDLLDFTMARVGSGLSVTLRDIDWHETVARGVENLAVAFPGREIRHTALGSGNVLADAERVSQLLGNLVANALAYGEVGKPVSVTSEVTADQARLLVHNCGEPITPEMQASMFAPMVRGTSTAGSKRSVGLGLFIVQAIAAAHGGRVEVASNSADGTTFVFSFVRDKAAGASSK